MASSLLYNNTPFMILFLVFTLFLIPSTNSLTTVSISETTNQTLICALTASRNSRNPSRHSLNCTTFHGGAVRTPTNLDNPLSETVSGDGFLCGLIDFQSSPSISVLTCSRFSTINDSNQTNHRIYQGSALRELDSGNSHICAIVNATNRLECWQWKEFRNSYALSSSAWNFSKISVGEDFVCGITSAAAGGNISCVGSNRQVAGQQPPGNYSEIASGVSHACAISAVDGGLKCWGNMLFNNTEERFLSLASGENRSCGLRYNKTVVCWGQDGFVLPEALRETEFFSIEGKRKVFCGVLFLNSSLYCWGGSYNNASMVFESVMPGPCRAQFECRCGPVQGQGKYCGSGSAVCQTCPVENPTPPEILAPAPAPAPAPSQRHRGWSRKMVAFMVVGCVGCTCLVLICGFFLFRYCKGRVCRVHDSGRLDEIGSGAADPGSNRRQTRPSGRVLEKRQSYLISAGTTGTPLEEFSLQVLMDATENFSEQRKIGAGSFGSVYHGKLPDGREVAVKRAESSPSSSSHLGGTTTTRRQEADDNKDRAFARELEFLSRLNHKNLIRLLGFHEDSKERVLVYEYLSNGTLHDHLHRAAAEDSPLRSWPERIRVAAEAARGIQYLHDFAVPSIIHRDIKSANILLNESWTAKVSDFGLSLMGPEDEGAHLSAKAAGTVGYIDPEYFRRQKLTSKSDVYSFGVVLLELLSGQKAIHKNENGIPRNVVDYVVPYIVQDEIHRALDRRVAPPTPYEIEAVAYVGYLAADCVTLEGRDRPNMAEIVSSLERALAACLSRPQLSRSTTESST